MATLSLAKALFGVASASSSAITAASTPNALTMDPKEVISGSDTAYLDLDLGAAYDLDTFFAGFLSGTPNLNLVQVFYGSTLGSRTTNIGTSQRPLIVMTAP